MFFCAMLVKELVWKVEERSDFGVLEKEEVGEHDGVQAWTTVASCRWCVCAYQKAEVYQLHASPREGPGE